MVLVMISGASCKVLRGFGRPCWWVLGVLWGVLGSQVSMVLRAVGLYGTSDGIWAVLGGLERSWEALLVALPLNLYELSLPSTLICLLRVLS